MLGKMRALETIIVLDRERHRDDEGNPESRSKQASRLSLTEGALRAWEAGRSFPPHSKREETARKFTIKVEQLNRAIEHDQRVITRRTSVTLRRELAQ